MTIATTATQPTATLHHSSARRDRVIESALPVSVVIRRSARPRISRVGGAPESLVVRAPGVESDRRAVDCGENTRVESSGAGNGSGIASGSTWIVAALAGWRWPCSSTCRGAWGAVPAGDGGHHVCTAPPLPAEDAGHIWAAAPLSLAGGGDAAGAASLDDGARGSAVWYAASLDDGGRGSAAWRAASLDDCGRGEVRNAVSSDEDDHCSGGCVVRTAVLSDDDDDNDDGSTVRTAVSSDDDDDDRAAR
jgi:hypothetical protein